MNSRLVSTLLLLSAGFGALAAYAAESASGGAWFSLTPTTVTMPSVELFGAPPSETASRMALPKHSLQAGLWASGEVPPHATAELETPKGLMDGSPISLRVGQFLPAPASLDPRFKTRYYYGSGEKVKSGQPFEFTSEAWNKISASGKGSIALLPDGLLADLPDTASAKGTYALHSDWGDASAEIAPAQDFLDPVEIASPKPGERPDTSQPLSVSWRKVARAKAYLVSAFGSAKAGTDGERVMWLSASDPRVAMHSRGRWGEEGSLSDAINRGWYLGASVTHCTIPAGIFAQGTPVTITVTAFGEETRRTNGDGTAKSAASAPSVVIAPQSVTTVIVGLPRLDNFDYLKDLGKNPAGATRHSFEWPYRPGF
jgi:hypothetical protein